MTIKVGDTIPSTEFKYVPYTPELEDKIPLVLELRNKFKERNVDIIDCQCQRSMGQYSSRVQGLKEDWAQKPGSSVDFTSGGLGVRTGRWVIVLDDLKVTTLLVEVTDADES
ncbi:Redoxin [Auriculariales sp. MPI-PUGE-AT-0066]|nr:Redoxin [Auriculariales sp. MPI-PUGE-AT-0066]